MIKYLGRVTSFDKMRNLVPGLFSSKLRYGLPLTATVWGLSKYCEQERQHLTTTKKDIYKLQSLQRQAASLVVGGGLSPLTPTADVLLKANWLSVHQLGASVIISLTLRIIKTQKPKYLADRLIRLPDSRTQRNNLQIPKCRLNLAFEGFICQATCLFNMLPVEIKTEDSHRNQKKLVN